MKLLKWDSEYNEPISGAVFRVRLIGLLGL